MKTIFDWTRRNATKLGIFGVALVIIVGIAYGVSKIISSKKAEDAKAEASEEKTETKSQTSEKKEGKPSKEEKK